MLGQPTTTFSFPPPLSHSLLHEHVYIRMYVYIPHMTTSPYVCPTVSFRACKCYVLTDKGYRRLPNHLIVGYILESFNTWCLYHLSVGFMSYTPVLWCFVWCWQRHFCHSLTRAESAGRRVACSSSYPHHHRWQSAPNILHAETTAQKGMQCSVCLIHGLITDLVYNAMYIRGTHSQLHNMHCTYIRTNMLRTQDWLGSSHTSVESLLACPCQLIKGDCQHSSAVPLEGQLHCPYHFQLLACMV